VLKNVEVRPATIRAVPSSARLLSDTHHDAVVVHRNPRCADRRRPCRSRCRSQLLRIRWPPSRMTVSVNIQVVRWRHLERNSSIVVEQILWHSSVLHRAHSADLQKRVVLVSLYSPLHEFLTKMLNDSTIFIHQLYCCISWFRRCHHITIPTQ